MKILINTPVLTHQGGVANHYLGLRKYWTENVHYNQIGRRGNIPGSGVLFLPWDILKFLFKLIFFRPDVVLVNPSFYKSALVRDSIFISIAYALNIKTAIFIHGFDTGLFTQMDKSRIVKTLNKSIGIFVLAQEFKDFLKSLGVKSPICITTTKVDDQLLSGFDLTHSRSGETILFLSRITKEKGIMLVLDIYEQLLADFPNLKLRVVGDGSALEAAMIECGQRHLTGVTFTGALSGGAISDEYSNADIYLFPTWHTEGMPTTVLEAMAFGLPVVTRPVGGLRDFFENGKMGAMVQGVNVDDYMPIMRKLINDQELRKGISSYNYRYAKEHFMASKVAASIEASIKSFIK